MKLSAYLVAVLIILSCGYVVAVHDHETAEQAQNAASHPRNGTVPESNEQAAEDYIKNAERSEGVGYRLFRWPEGIGAWFVLLTLIAIADQSYHTQRSAEMSSRGITLSVTEKRPRLHLEPQPFQIMSNGNPDVRIRVRNIGSSKARFGLCLCGMKAVGLEEPDIVPPKPDAMMTRLTNEILEGGDSVEDTIRAHFTTQVFPHGFDVTKPFKLHIFGVLNFRDILFEDLWVREFHYVLLYAPNTYMVHLGKWRNEYWQPLIEEVDIMRRKPRGLKMVIPRIRSLWAAYEAWIEKEESDDQQP